MPHRHDGHEREPAPIDRSPFGNRTTARERLATRSAPRTRRGSSSGDPAADIGDLLHARFDPFEYYPRLRRVREWVNGNIDRTITLDDAAGIACLETKYFSRFFRTKTGMTFTTFVNTWRVARAAAMLSRQDHSIQTVAAACGFPNHRNCERWFRRVLGMSPRAFKRSLVSDPHLSRSPDRH